MHVACASPFNIHSCQNSTARALTSVEGDQSAAYTYDLFLCQAHCVKQPTHSHASTACFARALIGEAQEHGELSGAISRFQAHVPRSTPPPKADARAKEKHIEGAPHQAGQARAGAFVLFAGQLLERVH